MSIFASNALIIECVDPATVRPLRAAILRPDRPPTESIYPLDDDAETLHLGAFDGARRIIGTASVFHQPADVSDPHVPSVHGERDPWRGGDAWRLRGMTVIEPMRGSGCGAMLLRAAIAHLAAQRAACLWFHARASAGGFYQRFGFAAIGPVYDTPHIGEHVFMWRAIDGVEQ